MPVLFASAERIIDVPSSVMLFSVKSPGNEIVGIEFIDNFRIINVSAINWIVSK